MIDCADNQYMGIVMRLSKDEILEEMNSLLAKLVSLDNVENNADTIKNANRRYLICKSLFESRHHK